MRHLPLSLSILSLLPLCAPALRADDPFNGPRAKLHYAPDMKFEFRHLKLELTPDVKSRTLRGVATHTVAPLAAGEKELRLDAEELQCDGASVNGAAANCATTDTEFVIALPAGIPVGEALTVRVEYHGKPRKGIYFFGPEQLGPSQPVSIWTQGEDEDNHFWFPGFDHPNAKFTSELTATVPGNYTVISNGKLEAVTANPDGTKNWHWVESVPHSNYLTSLVAGEYEKFHQSWRGLDVDAYVPRGRLSEAETAFGRTPQMMDYFSEVTGQPYPYEKYAQSAVPEFIFGGMENISATTQSDRTLHPARLDEEDNSDTLVSHELAHQWFGDYVSFKDWANAWLAEGFADYFEYLWTEHHEGVTAAQWNRDRGTRWYFASAGRFKRPVVTHYYSDPQDLFDANAYPKGGWILHMLRSQLGDALFFKGLKEYVASHKAGLADSNDLRLAFEHASGRRLDQFFDQWVFHPGHPELDTAWSYDATGGTVTLTIKQSQKLENGVRLFRFPLPVELLYEENGKLTRERKTFEVSEASHSFAVPASRSPVAVLFDPDATVLMKQKAEPGESALIAQLRWAENPVLRASAAKQLGEKSAAERARAALRTALADDSFWGVRAAAGEALAKTHDESGAATLFAAIRAEKSGRVRRRLVEALGEFKFEKSLIPDLKKIIEGDPSDHVRAAALDALGEFDAEGQFEYFKGKLNTPSHHEEIRGTVLRSWGAHHVMRALPLLYDAAAQGANRRTRRVAVEALGELGAVSEKKDEKEKIREFLVARIDDPQFFVIGAALDALGTLGDPAAVPALRAASTRLADSRHRQDAIDAIETITERPEGAGDLGKLRHKVEALEEDKADLEKRLRALERKSEPPASSPTPAPPAAKPAETAPAAKTAKPATAPAPAHS